MITVNTTIKNKTLFEVWDYFTNPKHIVNWNFASDDWHCPRATNDLRVGGRFNFNMSSKDGKMGFDFEGLYTNVIENECFEYVLEDNRKIIVTFQETENGIEVVEKFDPEKENSEEMQQTGWQMILNNFKKYIENL